MTESPPQHVNVFFRALVPAVGAFVVTMFAFIATLFSDPEAERSPASAFVDRHAVTLFVVEVAAIIVLSVAAMVLDRRQSLRFRSERPSSPGEAFTSDQADSPDAPEAS